MPDLEYIVVCRENQKEDGTPGDYTLATRTVFPNKEVADTYASGCASTREALVIGGRFGDLRRDYDERFGNQQLSVTNCEKHGRTVAIRHEAGLMCRACFIESSRSWE